MSREQVDAIVVTRRQDVQYLTGYHSRASNVPVGCVLAEDSQPQLIVSDMQAEETSTESVMGRVWSFPFVSEEDWFRAHGTGFWEQLVGVVKQFGLERGMLGIQHDWISVRGFDKLKTLLPQAGFKDFSQPLWRLRHFKDPAEIEAIRQAVTIAEIGVRTALEIVSSGKSEEEASLEIESAMRGAGGQLRGIRAAVLTGGHARVPFAQPGPQRIGTDTLAVLDITVSQSGYFAEVARTIHLGQPSDQQKKMFKSVLRLAELIEKNMRPDNQIQDLVTNVVKKMGRRFDLESLIQPLGSSIGLDLREPPYLSQDSQFSLREGMVFTIHPTMCLADAGCAKVADVITITSDGHESLGSLSRETL
jgi:Xaa-Pro dipeptidase